MMNENNELILELWTRLKPSIPPKERLQVADMLIVVFDEFGKFDDDLINEDLDKELRAAVKSHMLEPEDGEDEDFDAIDD